MLSPQQRLQALKAALELTITDMAELFDVTRPSIYAWLKGQEPRPDNLSRLGEFEDAADRVITLGIPRISKLLKRPLRSGRSFFSLMKMGGALDAALRELADAARSEQAQRNSLKGRHDLLSSREAAVFHSLEAARKDS